MTFAACGSIIHHQAAGLWEWEALEAKQYPCHIACPLLGLTRAQLNWQDAKGKAVISGFNQDTILHPGGPQYPPSS